MQHVIDASKAVGSAVTAAAGSVVEPLKVMNEAVKQGAKTLVAAGFKCSSLLDIPCLKEAAYGPLAIHVLWVDLMSCLVLVVAFADVMLEALQGCFPAMFASLLNIAFACLHIGFAQLLQRKVLEGCSQAAPELGQQLLDAGEASIDINSKVLLESCARFFLYNLAMLWYPMLALVCLFFNVLLVVPEEVGCPDKSNVALLGVSGFLQCILQLVGFIILILWYQARWLDSELCGGSCIPRLMRRWMPREEASQQEP